MLTSAERVVVLGAGPAGLAVARLLHRHGVPTRVLERDAGPTVRGQGGSLDLTEDAGLRAIAAMGLSEAFDLLARPQGQRFRVLDRTGTVRLDLGPDAFPSARPEIDRVALRDLLLGSLPPGTVSWDSTVRELRPRGNGWDVEIADGTVVPADVVVAADGIGSRARPLVTDDVPAYSGVTFVAGDILRPRPDSTAARLVGDGAAFVLGDERALMGQRSGDGSIRLYAALRLPDDPRRRCGVAAPEQVRTMLRESFSGWAPDVIGMLDEVDGGFSWWPLHGVPPRQRWRHRPGLTLVGDAAHVMPPFTGQGVTQALLDAVELVAELAGPGTVDDGLAAYERRMLARMEPVITAALAAQDRMITPDGPAPLLATMAGSAA